MNLWYWHYNWPHAENWKESKANKAKGVKVHYRMFSIFFFTVAAAIEGILNHWCPSLAIHHSERELLGWVLCDRNISLRRKFRWNFCFLTASSSRAGAVLVMAFSCVYSKSWSIKFHKHKMSNIMVNQISYYSVHIKIMVNQISLEVFI